MRVGLLGGILGIVDGGCFVYRSLKLTCLTGVRVVDFGDRILIMNSKFQNLHEKELSAEST